MTPHRILFALGLMAFSAPAVGQTTPDLSGPWQIVDPQAVARDDKGAPPPLLPAARKVWLAHVAARKAGKPEFDNILRCTPPGVPRLMSVAMPFRIIQGQRHTVMLFGWNHMSRILYMNQPHFESIGSEYLGQSIAKWEGQTLVVDTNSFNDATVLDDSGLPHSDQMTTKERFSIESDQLVDRITITDPKTFARPWTMVLRFVRQPGAIIKEDFCLARMGLGVSKSK